MTNPQNFTNHRIEPVGLSIEIYRPWPLESLAEGDHGNIYQRIGDTAGIVFLRYGPDETVDAFLKTLVGAITTVSVQSDQATVFCGQNARRLTLQQDRSAMGIYRRQADQHLVHEHSPAERTTISVISFTHRNTPVLIGYRILAESLAAYRQVLEQIMNSVKELRTENRLR